jgi:plasmid stabilization system protein ParE
MPPTAYTVRYTPLAIIQISDQAIYYADHQSGFLALEFQKAVKTAAASLRTFPLSHKTDSDVGARAVKAKPFQFAIWYDVFDDTEVLILAVTHWRMNPAAIARKVTQARHYAAATIPTIGPAA